MSYTVKSFTVSHSFETYRGGEKRSHFMSFSCDMSGPSSPEEASLAGVDASRHVTAAVIYEAVARGCVTPEDGKQMLSDSETRHRGIAEAMEKKWTEGRNAPKEQES